LQQHDDKPPFGPSQDLLRGRFLASCHGNGNSYVWDLHRQSICAQFCGNRGGPGLALRRLQEEGGSNCEEPDAVMSSPPPRVIYQTRDKHGIVSLHEVRPDGSVQELQSLQTGSQSFCAAAPCNSSSLYMSHSMVAVPDADETVAVVRDWRVPSTSHPVAVLRTPTKDSSVASGAASTPIGRNHGMLTSLAFNVATATAQEGSNDGSGACRPVVACGMESGHVLLYDLAQPSTVHSVEDNQSPSSSSTLWWEEPSAQLSLGRDPVMALDMVPSKLPSPLSPTDNLDDSPSALNLSSRRASVLVAAGLAGTLEDVSALPPTDQGRVALVKCTWTGSWKVRVRSRFATCKIPPALSSSSMTTTVAGGGKPGVSLCRFRPGAGRFVAVAGWDRRVRIFDRSTPASLVSTSTPSPGFSSPDPLLTLLRGHSTTVSSLDWAADAEASGLIATGGSEGRINIWKLDL
jgi:WD40 repeat protein